MNVCVTGGSGFIGWYMVRALVGAGHRVTVLDLVDPPGDLAEHRFVRGDVRHPEALRAAARGCDAVCHLAAAHHDFGISDETFHEVNVTASRIMCEVMDELAVRRCCFYSTAAVYGAAPAPLAETTEPRPETPYGKTKLAGEEIFRVWTEQGGGRRCLVIRPTVTFGPRNFANMYSLIRQIERGKFVFVGPASNVKSLSYVENIVEATMFLLDREDLPAFDVYNYVEKPDFTSRRIALAIFESMDRRPPRITIPMWAARTAALPFDLAIAVTGRNIPISGARIRKLFREETRFEADKIRAAGFTPSVPLPEGIDRMVRWYLETGRDQVADWHQPPSRMVETVEEKRRNVETSKRQNKETATP